jgi:hypothetical protein
MIKARLVYILKVLGIAGLLILGLYYLYRTGDDAYWGINIVREMQGATWAIPAEVVQERIFSAIWSTIKWCGVDLVTAAALIVSGAVLWRYRK